MSTAANSRFAFVLRQPEYEQGIAQRIRPEDIQASLNYVFRWLVPGPTEPRYAIEDVGRILRIGYLYSSTPDRRLTFESGAGQGVFNLRMNSEGFIVKPFAEVNSQEQVSRHREIGYLMNEAALGSGKLAIAPSTPELAG